MTTPTYRIVQNIVTAPVTVSKFKNHLQLWGDDSYDDELSKLLLTATEYVGNHIGKAVGQIAVDMFLTSFDDAPLLHDNATDIAISYYDENNTLQTLASSEYLIDPTVTPQEIIFKTRLNLSNDYANPVVVSYSAGMDFPPLVIQHAILMTAAELFEVRTESTDAQARVAQITVSRLLAKDKRVVI